jgi:hypothetical protein
MVSKKTLKSYEFETIFDYFEYIFDSVSNGQKKQTKELFNKLSESQKIEFYEWLDTFTHYDKEEGENAVLEFLNYIN